MRWDREVDVLVFGAGMGGMTAALVASLEGLDVLLCEKTDQVGGTTSTSAGTVWIPGSSQAVRDGVPDSVDDARRFLEAEIGPSSPRRRAIRTITRTSPAGRSPAGHLPPCRLMAVCWARTSGACVLRSRRSWFSAA